MKQTSVENVIMTRLYFSINFKQNLAFRNLTAEI